VTTIPTPESPGGLLGRARRVIRATEGGTAIEYALVAGLIALVIVGALGELGGSLIALPLPARIDAFQSVLS
jgi:Flp pilus assembly pilin Flp